jgi:hypothetical protein
MRTSSAPLACAALLLAVRPAAGESGTDRAGAAEQTSSGEARAPGEGTAPPSAGLSYAVRPAPPAEPPPPETKDKKDDLFEDHPDEAVDDAGHAVPTQHGLYHSRGGLAAPFSVGGAQAVVGEDTWFKFYGFIQTRVVGGHYEDTSESDAAGSGFSVPRARLFFYGRMTDWLRVLVRVGTTTNGAATFEQAFADFHRGRLTLRLGRFNLPTFFEQSYSPVNALLLETSAVGSLFDGGQTQGLRLSADFLPVRVHLFLNDGLRTGFAEVGSAERARLAASARVEGVIGDDDYDTFSIGSSFRAQRPALLGGLSLHYQHGGESADGAEDLGQLSADVTLKGSGYTLSVSTAVQRLVLDASAGEYSWRYGGVGQAGLFVLPWTELVARYEVLVAESTDEAESAGEPGQSLLRGVAGGVTQYLWPARGIRAMVDFTYYFDPTLGTPVPTRPSAGLFASSSEQWALRAQINVLF